MRIENNQKQEYMATNNSTPMQQLPNRPPSPYNPQIPKPPTIGGTQYPDPQNISSNMQKINRGQVFQNRSYQNNHNSNNSNNSNSNTKINHNSNMQVYEEKKTISLTGNASCRKCGTIKHEITRDRDMTAVKDQREASLSIKKLETMGVDYQILNEAYRKLQRQAIKLRERNNFLQAQLQQLLHQLSQLSNLKETQGINRFPIPHKSSSINPPTSSSSAIPSQISNLIHSLQSQNQLLIQFKDSCLAKISSMEQHVQFLESALERERAQGVRKAEQLHELRHLHKEDIQNVKAMEQLIQETNGQLNHILKDAKHKQQESGALHDRFHQEMAKLKAKNERYRNKMEEYRKERDILALEIQKAKFEIGTVTLRKYFPDDSDEE